MSDLYMSYKILESNENHFKTCTKCGETLPATTEYFHKDKKGKYGLVSKCKRCRAEQDKQYREDNKDKIAEYQKQWYENNKDKKLKQSKQYREKNRDKITERSKQYHENNKDKISERHKQWYENNKDKILERRKQHYKDNKYKIAEYKKQYYATPQGQVVAFNKQCRRRTREQNQGNGINKEQWLECMKFFGFRCAYSGQILSKDTRSLDHIEPLNNGGEHEIWNIVPMYRPYNSSKQDKDMEKWYQEQDFYSEERLQKIYEWQEYAFNKYSKK